ncbi:MAG TPA: nicotinate-nucleotide diphosphorylase (carboxylating), partial [Planctomycetota bacterium]|nr:nicotinate-nucleotide diphosphorylase (carboxylating) [Planctomycetota bacterium]
MTGRTVPTDAIAAAVDAALAEDVGPGDVTSEAVVPESLRARATIVAREEGILAGVPCARRAFERLDPKARVIEALEDGAELRPGA